MATQEQIETLLWKALADLPDLDLRQDTQGQCHYVDAFAYPPRQDGRDWQILFSIEIAPNSVTVDSGVIDSGPGNGDWDNVCAVGDVDDHPEVPAEVAAVARDMGRRIAALDLPSIDLGKEARQLLDTLQAVAAAKASGDEEALSAAIEEARLVVVAYRPSVAGALPAPEPGDASPRP